MTLRRKLFILFGSLVAMTFLAAGITTWAVINWKTTENDLQRHYERSLKLQNVRALTFQAVLEVPEGLTGNDPDARQDFEETIAPASDSLRTWAQLVDTAEEREEVEQVQSAFDALVADSHLAFDHIEAGDFAEADRLFDEQIEEASSESFQAVTDQAEATDADRREVIHDATKQTRHTAEVMLIITAISAFGIALLLAAYLISDVFTPLRDVRRALAQVRKGDRSVRLNEERHDEFGQVNQEFNRLVTTLAEAECSAASPAMQPTRPVPAPAPARTIERAPVRPLVYETVSRLHADLADHSADLEITFDTSVSHAPVDYLTVQQALATLIVDTMSRADGPGAHIGLRISDTGDDQDPRLVIEVGGTRSEASSISSTSSDESNSDLDGDQRTRANGPHSLALVRAVAHQHGGALALEDLGSQGYYARMELSLVTR